jgi:type IV fimbrial biogenesis protein FimT
MKSPLSPLHSARGVTLLELMIAITVLAILAGIGIPAFSGILRANAIAAQANNLVSALTLARSEAMKRGIRVSVCPTQNGADCTADWNDGWVVFTDDFGTPGDIDESDEPLQNWSAGAAGVVVTGSNSSITFLPSAASNAGAIRTFSITKDGCVKTQRRQISVWTTGRISLTPVSCVVEEDEEEEEEEGS